MVTLAAKWAAGVFSPAALVSIIFRPRLRLEARIGKGEDGDFRQAVSCYAGMDTLGTRNPTGPAYAGLPIVFTSRAMYIRVSVRNSGWFFPAKRCRVFVKNIRLNGRIIEESDAQLGWKGREHLGERFEPQIIDRSQRLFVDVCGAHEGRPRLSVKSLREQEGYKGFTEPGVYTFEIVAIGEAFCERDTLMLEIRYDGQWDKVEVLSAKSIPGWKRWP